MFILFHHPLVLLVDVEHFANTLGSLLRLGRAGEGMVVGGDIGHDSTLVWLGGGVDVWSREKHNIVLDMLPSNINNTPLRRYTFTFKNYPSSKIGNSVYCTFSVQHLGNIKVLLSNFKCKIQVVHVIALFRKRHKK